jgi:hypothetical protein
LDWQTTVHRRDRRNAQSVRRTADRTGALPPLILFFLHHIRSINVAASENADGR